MESLKGKRLLILGGANQHLKFVEAAKELGVYTIVTDYLQDSPCKRISDESLLLNITDIDGIVSYCEKNHVDGVISGFLDPCQVPYAQICSQLHLPCYGTMKQFYKFTNKIAFKKLCEANGVKVIPDYQEQDYKSGAIEYPVFVKPVDSRGSRGQSVCFSEKEMPNAIKFAKEQSSNGDILIERYMGDCDEIQITYFVVNGKIYLERTVDSYRGNEAKKLQKVVNCSISPSRYTDIYLRKAHPSVCRMIQAAGIQNGPVFMQGFHKNGEFYFFDPGLRFPGVEFERIYKRVWNIDMAQLLIFFALKGRFPPQTALPEDGAKLRGMVAAVLFPVLSAGRIKQIEGLDAYCTDRRIVSCLVRYGKNDTVGWTFDVNQRYAEIDILGDDIKDIADTIENFYETVKIIDDRGQDMFFDRVRIENLTMNVD